MSIEKLSDTSKVLVEQVPFTQILNEIIDHIKDNDAFRLWCWLLSKPREWKVVKEYATKICDVGKSKAKECWSYLARSGLIEYIVKRDEKGKIIGHDVRVLIGLDFKKDEPFEKQKISTGMKTKPVETHRYENPPGGKSSGVDFRPLLNKDIKNNKDKKTKSFYRKQNEDKHAFAENMNQSASARRSEAKNEQYKKALMSDNVKAVFKAKPNHEPEIKQTAQFWGPGHPDYDRNHK